jgi:hypothetical protein
LRTVTNETSLAVVIIGGQAQSAWTSQCATHAN